MRRLKSPSRLSDWLSLWLSDWLTSTDGGRRWVLAGLSGDLSHCCPLTGRGEAGAGLAGLGWTGPEALLSLSTPRLCPVLPVLHTGPVQQLSRTLLTLQRNINLHYNINTNSQRKLTTPPDHLWAGRGGIFTCYLCAIGVVSVVVVVWCGVVWVVGCGLYLYFYTSLARLLWQPSKDSTGQCWVEREMTRISERDSREPVGHIWSSDRISLQGGHWRTEGLENWRTRLSLTSVW